MYDYILRVFTGALVCMICLCGSLSSQAGTAIGDIRLVVVWAYGTPKGSDRGVLYQFDNVYADQTVETVRGGGLHVWFRDDTDLRLGSASKAVLDRFVYDPDRRTGELVLSLLKGVFRYQSGKLPNHGRKVITPVALIGIRGTDFTVSVAEDGTTRVAVREGVVEITPLSGDAAVTVNVGQLATVTSSTTDATVTNAAAPTDPGLEDETDIDTGIDAGGGGGGGK